MKISIGSRLAAASVSPGFETYLGRPGTVARVFSVTGREKAVLLYGIDKPGCGPTWKPPDLEIFTDQCVPVTPAVEKLPPEELEDLCLTAWNRGANELAERIEEELERRENDASDPAVIGARQDAEDACRGLDNLPTYTN